MWVLCDLGGFYRGLGVDIGFGFWGSQVKGCQGRFDISLSLMTGGLLAVSDPLSPKPPKHEFRKMPTPANLNPEPSTLNALKPSTLKP